MFIDLSGTTGPKKTRNLQISNDIFVSNKQATYSSPGHNVLKVNFCGRSMSVVNINLVAIFACQLIFKLVRMSVFIKLRTIQIWSS